MKDLFSLHVSGSYSACLLGQNLLNENLKYITVVTDYTLI